MDSPFGSLFILIFFILFAYLYMIITDRRSQKDDFPSNKRDGEADVERRFAGYKKNSHRLDL